MSRHHFRLHSLLLALTLGAATGSAAAQTVDWEARMARFEEATTGSYSYQPGDEVFVRGITPPISSDDLRLYGEILQLSPEQYALFEALHEQYLQRDRAVRSDRFGELFQILGAYHDAPSGAEARADSNTARLRVAFEIDAELLDVESQLLQQVVPHLTPEQLTWFDICLADRRQARYYQYRHLLAGNLFVPLRAVYRKLHEHGLSLNDLSPEALRMTYSTTLAASSVMWEFREWMGRQSYLKDELRNERRRITPPLEVGEFVRDLEDTELRDRIMDLYDREKHLARRGYRHLIAAHRFNLEWLYGIEPHLPSTIREEFIQETLALIYSQLYPDQYRNAGVLMKRLCTEGDFLSVDDCVFVDDILHEFEDARRRLNRRMHDLIDKWDVLRTNQDSFGSGMQHREAVRAVDRELYHALSDMLDRVVARLIVDGEPTHPTVVAELEAARTLLDEQHEFRQHGEVMANLRWPGGVGLNR